MTAKLIAHPNASWSLGDYHRVVACKREMEARAALDKAPAYRQCAEELTYLACQILDKVLDGPQKPWTPGQ